MLRLGPGDLLQHLLLGVAVHRPREDTVLDGVQDDAPVRLGGRLLVQLGTCGRRGVLLAGSFDVVLISVF